MNISTGLKKIIIFVVSIVIICIAFVSLTLIYGTEKEKGEAFAAENKVISLRIGDPMMKVDGIETEIDPGRGTEPVIINDRTLLPVRAIIEAAGGSVDWDQAGNTVTLSYGSDVIRMVIGSTTAYINEEPQTIDTAPVIINDRTMLPIRFIAEGFGFDVGWERETQTVTITVPGTEQGNTPTADVNSIPSENLAGLPEVYMTTDISSEALMKIYNRLAFTPQGNVAVKLSTGEAGNTHYLDPNLIKNLVQSVNGTIVECNTAYGGARSSTAMHRQVAEDHGFTAIADVDIMDEDGAIELPVGEKAVNLERDIVGSHYADYDSMLVLSHFKGHAMGGFGGAIKNISIGIASSSGKMYIHSAGHSESSWSGGTQDQFLESMAEAAQAVHNDKQNDGGIVYISVMNHLSVDCDCDGNPAEPEMDDIGILASYDPVALDQACVDLVYAQKDGDGRALVERIESRNGIHTLEHAAEIGLGSREYNLISIDS